MSDGAPVSDRPAPPRVLAVLVTHNGERWLDSCLRSLVGQTYRPLDVMVVDSGSASPAAGFVRDFLPSAESIRLESNVGFGKAANRGLEASSHAPRADYFLFLHDDVALEPDCVRRLVQTALEADAGVVGGKGLAWDRPEVLLEVGMSADAFCYPFSGLEEGEIDQGQHDMRGEVLFVTSACMLVSRAALAKGGSWDGDYFLFTEDLDLCMRARLTGFKVMVQPSARFRHVNALVRGRRGGLTGPDIRFLTRRNRTRTIVKNASLPRVVPLLALFTTLSFLEMVLLTMMRRFEEVPAYPRAFGSFMATLPGLLRARAAIQKRRTEPDRRLRRLMIHYVPRARIFLERQLREWERGTIRLGTRTISKLTPSRVAAAVSAFLRRPATLTIGAVTLLLVLAMRRTVFGPPVGAGGLLPFPDPVHTLWSDWFASWRDAGLGTAAAPPAAFPLLGLFGVAGFGSPRMAQVLLELGLLVTGLAGIAVLVGRRTRDVPARVLAIVLYALAAPVRAAVETGDLAAMALYAGLPWLLGIVLRMLGPTPAEGGERAATSLVPAAIVPDVARAALISAGVVALAPTAWPVLGIGWGLLGVAAAAAHSGREDAGRRIAAVLGSLLLAPVLLVPWTLEAFGPDGPVFAALLGGRGARGAFGELWAGQTFAQGLFLGPGVGWLVRPAAIAATLGALMLSTPARRRESRILVAAWLGFAALGGLAGAGWIPAPAATPALWFILPSAVVAVLVSHLLAGLRHELPTHAIGWRHLASPVLVVVTVAGVVLPVGRAAGGWARPASTAAADAGGSGNSLASFFGSIARDAGRFRVLWVGRQWTSPVVSSVARRDGAPYVVAGPGGLTMRDAWAPTPVGGDRRLAATVQGMHDGSVHLAGHLLGPAGIRYVVADRSDPAALAAVNRQRDLVLDQQFGDAAVFRNQQWVPRASVATAELAAAARGPAGLDAQMQAGWAPGPAIAPRGAARFEGRIPKGAPARGRTEILVGDNFNRGWDVRVGDESLQHEKAFGWANRFTGPAQAGAAVRIRHTGQWLRLAGIVVQVLLLAMAASIARGSRRAQPAPVAASPMEEERSPQMQSTP